jgi:hypothetical protein
MQGSLMTPVQMRVLITLFLVGSIWLSGCSSPAPDYQPPPRQLPPSPSGIGTGNNEPGGAEPMVNTGENGTIWSNDTQTGPASNDSAVNGSAPGTGDHFANDSWGPTGTDCNLKSGEDQLQCQSQLAISNNDVKICTQLNDKDIRFKCITIWCSSAGRDYNQCDGLTDYDDRLGCLNKCNPNMNS